MKKCLFIVALLLCAATYGYAQTPIGWWVYPDGRAVPVYNTAPVQQLPPQQLQPQTRPNGVETASLVVGLAHLGYDVAMDWIPNSPRNGNRGWNNGWGNRWGNGGWNGNWNTGWNQTWWNPQRGAGNIWW